MSSDPPTVADRTHAVVLAARELGTNLVGFARSVEHGEPHRLAHQGYNIFQLEIALNEARMALLDAETGTYHASHTGPTGRLETESHSTLPPSSERSGDEGTVRREGEDVT